MTKIAHDKKVKKLEEAVQLQRKNIYVSSYKLLIGEICSMYLNDVFEIKSLRDTFTNKKKSELISYILTGRPINLSCIVYSDSKNCKWKILDGNQILVTILTFMGIHKEKHAFVLEKNAILPELSGFVYDKAISIKNNNSPFFSKNLQSLFKIERLDFKLISEDPYETLVVS